MGVPRTRTKTIVNQATQGYRRVTKYVKRNGICEGEISTVSTATTSEQLCLETKSMNDIVTAGFHDLVKTGAIVNNAMISSHIRFDNALSVGKIHTIDTCTDIAFAIDYVRERGIQYLGPPSYMQAEIDQMSKYASTKALANVSSEEINLPALIGELSETKEMLVKALRSVWRLGDTLDKFGRLIRYGSQTARSPLPKAQRIKNYYLAIENFWMEMRMGWRPFYYECQRLHNLAVEQKNFPPRQTFRSKAKKEFSNSDYITSSGERVCIFKRTYDNTVTVRAGTLAQQRMFGFPDTYGLTKIPQAVWELTTLSWAVDYFFNIGDLIAAHVPDTLWDPLCSWYVIEQHIVRTVKMERSYQADGSYQPDIVGGLRVHTEVKKDRRPCSYLGVTFLPRLNVAKYIDLLAVTRQHFVKSLKFFLKQKPSSRKRR